MIREMGRDAQLQAEKGWDRQAKKTKLTRTHSAGSEDRVLARNGVRKLNMDFLVKLSTLSTTGLSQSWSSPRLEAVAVPCH